MRLGVLPQPIAWGAFASVCLTPFLSGGVERSVWIPLCQLWLLLGLTSAVARSRLPPAGQPCPGLAVSRALLPFHALFALQLVPMPATVLRALSPGSFAAHFLPNPGDGRFRSLSVSPGATVEAWLYVAGLQGLFLALQGQSISRRRGLASALLGVILLLATEGLWQSRSAHPYWLSGWIPVYLPSGFETSVFGPYFNRNHFATAVAMGSGLAAGLATTLAREAGGLQRLLSDPAALPRAVLLAGASIFLAITSAASGSRSGALAALAGIGVVVVFGFGKRFFLMSMGLGVATLALTGAAAVDRLLRLDLQASRLTPWADMLNLLRFFPIFGSGMGTFAVAYWPYQTNVPYEFWPHAHNDYLQWLVETGLLGVAVLCLVGRALQRSTEFSDDSRSVALGVGAAFATQAALDFPCRVPASAAIVVCVFALTTSRRQGTSMISDRKSP